MNLLAGLELKLLKGDRELDDLAGSDVGGPAFQESAFPITGIKGKVGFLLPGELKGEDDLPFPGLGNMDVQLQPLQGSCFPPDKSRFENRGAPGQTHSRTRR